MTAQVGQDASSNREQDLPQWGKRYNSDSKAESPWARKVILSLDGGGVKGYSSLLILKALMREIKTIEKNMLPPYESSMSCPWSNRELDPIEHDFLIHHYVDYFFGTSTGGLSAIMLGRLRMTINQALDSYDAVGMNVFKRPRKRGRGKLKMIFDRFDGKLMDEVLKKATVPEADNRKALDFHAGNIRMRDPVSDSSRTVVVACAVNNSEPYLFRSYDHPHPNPGLGTNERNRHINPGPASDVAVWLAGRATSAAPGWFPAVEIDRNLYEDGAMAECNNPVILAYNEVKQMVPLEPSVIISIGTGTKTPRTDSEGNDQQAPSKLSWYRKKVNQYITRLGNSDKAHNDYLDKMRDRNAAVNPDYFRFNVQTNFGKVSLGDWIGDEGSSTKQAIRQPTENYIDEMEGDIRQCAQKLVDIRRRRAATARWEAFASDQRLYYQCPMRGDANRGCEGLRFDSRLELRQHAIERHGFVWRIRCGHFPHGHLATQTGDGIRAHSHIEWTCLWDGCEKEVSTFDEKSDFEAHLRSAHGYENIEVQSSEQDFEKWLDKGRVFDAGAKPQLRHTTRSQMWDTGAL